MSEVVSDRPKFKWTVKFRWATDDEMQEHKFKGTFERMTATEVTKRSQDLVADGLSVAALAEWLDEVLVDHEGLTLPEMQDRDHAAQRLFILSDPAVVQATHETYVSAILGRAESAKGKR